MKHLRRRKIAKSYGIKYTRSQDRDGSDLNFFDTKRYGIGFRFCDNATFLHVVKNKDKWFDSDFDKRKITN